MATNYGFEPTLDGLNNIDSDSTTTTNIVCDTITINTSGTAPTMTAGDNSTNIATTAYVDNATTGAFVTLAGTQTITGEKTLSNANTFITGNTVTDSIQSSAVGTTQNIATTQTSGVLNVGTLGSRSGAININTGGTTTAPVNISTASTSFNTVSIGSVGGTVSIGGATTFTSTTPCSFGFGLNTNTINVGTVTANMTIAGTQTSGQLNIGNLSSRTGPITIGSGTSTKTIAIGNPTATTTNIFGSTLALDTSTTGIININTGATSTAQVNISSGTTLNAPITIGSSSSTTQTCSMNAETTFNKNVNIQDTVTWRFGNISSGLALSMAGVNTFTWELLNTLDTCYFNDYTGAAIMYFNTTEIITGKRIVFGGTTATFNNNVLINQTNTTTGMGTTQIGYTVENTTRSTDAAATQMSNGVTKNILSFTPAKGVWVVSFNWKLTANTSGGSGTVDGWEVCLSATTASMTEYRSFNALRELNDALGGSGGVRDRGNLSGVINADGATAYYINANIRFSGLAAPNTVYLAIPMLTYTRIG